VAARVHLLPPTSSVEQFYGMADALLLPSPYDAFAMVVTEAMACALPVIVSREAGASELINDGENGFVLQNPGDDAELAGYMRRIQEDPGYGGRVGRGAREARGGMTW